MLISCNVWNNYKLTIQNYRNLKKNVNCHPKIVFHIRPRLYMALVFK
jgi:hypothetical protein